MLREMVSVIVRWGSVVTCAVCVLLEIGSFYRGCSISRSGNIVYWHIEGGYGRLWIVVSKGSLYGIEPNYTSQYAPSVEWSYGEPSLILPTLPIGVYHVGSWNGPMFAFNVTVDNIWVAPCAVGVLAWGIADIYLIRRYRQCLRGYCRHCGYNLEGNRSGSCPECGVRRKTENGNRSFKR